MRRQGFTLIELLVVMAVIATLLTLAVPRYFDHLERAREATLRTTLGTVRDAIDKFRGDTGRYPETLEELVRRQYLRRVPIDPLTDSAETWVLVPPPEGSGSGARDLRSGAEGNGRDGTPFADW